VKPISSKRDNPVFDVRALLAEDNIINQKVAALHLKKLGCRIDVAANGKEAVEMTSTIQYDIVFMDCQMPEMDGYEVCMDIINIYNLFRQHVKLERSKRSV
jgi:CheY-like chemotaxis protein